MTGVEQFTTFAATTAVAGVYLWAQQGVWLMAAALALGALFLATMRLTAFRGPYR